MGDEAERAIEAYYSSSFAERRSAAAEQAAWKAQQNGDDPMDVLNEFDDGNGVTFSIDPGETTGVAFSDLYARDYKHNFNEPLPKTITGRMIVETPFTEIERTVAKYYGIGRNKNVRSRRQILEAQLRAISDMLGQMAERPDEPQPVVVEGESWVAPIIYFKKMFGKPPHVQTEKVYDYVCIRGNDGLWYSTGPSVPRGCTWDALVDWLEDTGPMPTIYRLTGAEVLWDPNAKKELTNDDKSE